MTVDPIQILFAAIEHFMERVKETTGDEQDGHMLSAVSIAKEAAPYCHPKLRAVELTGRDGSALVAITPYTDEELDVRWRAHMASKAQRTAGAAASGRAAVLGGERPAVARGPAV